VYVLPSKPAGSNRRIPVFEALYPLILPHLREQAAMDEWARNRTRRHTITDEVFNPWKRQQPAATWSCLPPMEVVFGVWFYDLIHSDESLTDEKIKAAVRRVPGLYETWFERRRGDLMAAMKDSPCRASDNVCRHGNDTACPHINSLKHSNRHRLFASPNRRGRRH
jgi:hypothetical protein